MFILEKRLPHEALDCVNRNRSRPGHLQHSKGPLQPGHSGRYRQHPRVGTRRLLLPVVLSFKKEIEAEEVGGGKWRGSLKEERERERW